MNSIDEKLIAEIAVVWVDGGGDSDGIHWCYYDIVRAVDEEIAKREESEVTHG